MRDLGSSSTLQLEIAYLEAPLRDSLTLSLLQRRLQTYLCAWENYSSSQGSPKFPPGRGYGSVLVQVETAASQVDGSGLSRCISPNSCPKLIFQISDLSVMKSKMCLFFFMLFSLCFIRSCNMKPDFFSQSSIPVHSSSSVNISKRSQVA